MTEVDLVPTGRTEKPEREQRATRQHTWGHTAFAAVAILVCTNGPSTFTGLHLVHPAELSFESWPFAYAFAPIAVAGGLLLFRYVRAVGVRSLGWPAVPLGAYLVVVVASARWSESPTLTPSRALVEVGVVAFAVWFGAALGQREQVWSLFLGCQVGVVSSALVLLVKPTWARMYPGIALSYWRGIYGNRNSLAPVCALALLTSVPVVLMERRRRVTGVVLPLALLDTALLAGSKGGTAVAAVAVGVLAPIVAVPTVRLLRTRNVPGRLAAAVVVPLAAGAWSLFFAHLHRIASLLGRDDTFTSRRPIWAAVRELIRVHPVRGYGYWAIWDSSAVGDLYARVGPIGSAHNSVLETMLAVGILGTVPWAILVLAALGRPVQAVWRRGSIGDIWWLAIIAFAAVENATESFVLWHSYLWVLVVAAAFVPRSSNEPVRDPPQWRTPR